MFFMHPHFLLPNWILLKLPQATITPQKNKMLSKSEVFYVDGHILIKIVSGLTSYKKGREWTHKLPEEERITCQSRKEI